MLKRVSALAVVLGVVFAAHSMLLAWVPSVQSGQWAPIQPDPEQAATSMLQARDGAAAILLPNDRVLIIGGAGADGTALSSTEVFTPQGQFLQAAPMNIARKGHTATLLQYGRVLVAGGTTETGEATASVEIYNMSTDTWTLTGALQGARSGHTATLVADDQVVVVGGESGGLPVGSLEVYDGWTGNVTAAGPTGSARMSHAAAKMADGRVAIFGGSDGAATLATTEIFDPATFAIGAGPAMPQARKNAAAVSLLDGSIFIVGGHDGTADMGTAIRFDGTAFIGAGSLSMARQRPVAVLLPHNNSVLVFGGTLDGGAAGSAELYRPWSNTIVTTGLPGGLRATPVASPLKRDGLLLSGGGDGTNSAELYGFATLKTDKTDYSPGETVMITGTGWQPGGTVTLTLVESPKVHEDRTFTAEVGVDGQFVNTDFVPEPHHFGTRFYLTAADGVSQAHVTFTDGSFHWVGCASSDWTNVNNWANSSGQSCNGSNQVTDSSKRVSVYPGQNATSDTVEIQRGFVVANNPVLSTTLQTMQSVLIKGNSAGNGGLLTIATGGSMTINNTEFIIDELGDLVMTGGVLQGFTKLTLNTSNNSIVQSGGTIRAKGEWNNKGSFTQHPSGSTGTVEFVTGSTVNGWPTGTNEFQNVLINTGVTVDFGASAARTIVVKGNWTNNGTANMTSDSSKLTTVIFNGTGAQLVGGSSTSPFAHVTVNKTAGDVTLNSNQTINNTLIFTSGKIVTNGNFLTSGTFSAPTPTVTATGGHVVGNLKKFISGSTASRTFEVGTASSYAPVSVALTGLTNAGGSDDVLTATATAGDHPSIGSSGVDSNKAANLYWTVTKSGTWTLSNYSVTAQFTTASHDAGAVPANFRMKKFSGGVWSDPTPFTFTRASASGVHTVQASATSGSGWGSTFSDFVVGEVDIVNPVVSSIVRTLSSPTNDAAPSWQVTFSEDVTGVDATDFSPVSGGGLGGTPAIVGVTQISPSVYNVDVSSGTGSGTLGLNLNDNDSIVDGVGNKLGGTGTGVVGGAEPGNDSFAGEVYTIDRTLTPQITADNKVYNGNTTATLSDCSFTSALPVTEDVDVLCSSPTFDNANAGTRTVTANVALTGADASRYVLSSSTASDSADITPADQAAVTVTAPGSVTFGATGTAAATGGSSTGAFVFSHGASTGCSVSGTTVSVSDASGTCALTAYRQGDSNYNDSAVSASFPVTLNKASQAAVTVTAPSSVTYGTPATATAEGGSGTGAFSFSAGASTGCSVVDDQVSVTNASLTCALTATRAGDNNHLVSAESASFPVTLLKATQSAVTVTAPASVTFGTPGTAMATGGDGTGAYTFDAGESTGCTVSGDQVTVTNAAGTCDITATRDADDNYDASAESILFSVTLNKAAQAAVTVTAPSAVTYGTPQTATATGGSTTGAFTFSTGASTGCSVTGDQVEVTDASGTCALTATRAGDDNYEDSAASESFPVTLNKAAQAPVTVTAPSAVTYGTPQTATATGGSTTGAFTFSTGASTGCSVTGDQVEVTDASGTCALTATRAGDNNYEDSAASESFPVTLNKATSTTDITCPTNVPHTGSPQTPCTVSVTGAGGLNLSPAATYVNNTDPGTATASYTYAGDTNHTGSSDSKNFTIDPVVPPPVAFCFTGFLGPIGGAVENTPSNGGSFADPVKAFKLGSTIPVKFLLNAKTGSTCGAVVTTGIHTLQAIRYGGVNEADAPIDATPTDGATSGNQFRLTGTEWHFNLSTKGLQQGTWLLRATLQDGSVYTVWITIKK